ncbi:PCI domain-containing protein [Plasmodiophora brassicae]
MAPTIAMFSWEKSGADVKEGEKQDEMMHLWEVRTRLTLNEKVISRGKRAELLQYVVEAIAERKMGPFLKVFQAQHPDAKVPADLQAKLDKDNAEELAALDAKLTDAVENLGESEVRDAVQSKAEFFARIGDKAKAEETYKDAMGKTVGSGQKIDLMFDQIRLALFWNDFSAVRSLIEQTTAMVEKGGDWERRNRLKVYTAAFHLLTREFAEAAPLLLDSVSTFTCYELFSYRRFVLYTVLCTTVTQPRNLIREKLVNAPDVLAVIRDIDQLYQLLTSLSKCEYRSFFASLLSVLDMVDRDPFVHCHTSYVLRELRVVAYKQFLQSYKSITLASMAKSFNVSTELLDRTLSNYIAVGRVNCKIDKVEGIIETSRPDAKNAQYQSVLKHGDHLLNRIQKLSRVITY